MSIGELYGFVGIVAVIVAYAGCVLALVGAFLYGDDESEDYHNEP